MYHASTKRSTIYASGFVLLEGLLAIVIFGLMAAAFVGTTMSGLESAAIGGRHIRAAFIAEESMEALRNIRDAGFSNLTAGAHGFVTSSAIWNFSGASDAFNEFTRTTYLTAADTRRWRATTTVTWTDTAQRSGSLQTETMLTDWRRDFGNWGTPSAQAAMNLSGTANANAVALYATGTSKYLIIARDSSVSDELAIVDVTNPAQPSLAASLDLGASANDVAIAGNFAVIASAHNTQELQVVNIANPLSPSFVGSYDAPGSVDAISVAATGTTVFLGRNSSINPEVTAISIANPASPVVLDALDLAGDAHKMTLAQNGQYLYAATADNAQEVAIISIADPANMSIVGSFDAVGGSDGTAVAAFSTYGILGRADGTYNIFDASNPAAPTLVSSGSDLGSQINDIKMGMGDVYAFLATNTNNTPTRVLNVATPSSPALLESLTQVGSTNGIVWDFDLNRAFVVGTDDDELTVMQPN